MNQQQANLIITDEHHNDMKYMPRPVPFSSTLLLMLCCPCAAPCGFYTLQENEEAVMLRYGRYETTVREPGCHWVNICGNESKKVVTRKISVDLQNTKVVDSNGNPLLVSGVIMYSIENSARSVLEVQNFHAFVTSQASMVLKQVAARYPYESNDGHNLKNESAFVGEEFVVELQKKVSIAGAVIHSFAFNELAYAPEIAAGMLRKQQASALISARKAIVDGAVEIACGACQELEKRGIVMDNSEKAQLVRNLLTVICGEGNVQPTISTSH